MALNTDKVVEIGPNKFRYDTADSLITCEATGYFTNTSGPSTFNDKRLRFEPGYTLDIYVWSGGVGTGTITDRETYTVISVKEAPQSPVGEVTLAREDAGTQTDEIIGASGTILARVVRGKSNQICIIEVFGHTTDKPDEGDGTVDGTLQWALDLLTAQADGGEIWLMGGDDYQHQTALTGPTTGSLDGIRIRGFFGKKDHSIQPKSGSNITYLWDLGALGTSTDDFRIYDCNFYGRGDESNTSGGVRWKDFTSSYYCRNYMVRLDGVAVDWNSNGGATSGLNWMVDNTITQCTEHALELSGSGGNVDHRITGNYFNGITGSTAANFLVEFNARGGGTRFTENHVHCSFSKGFNSTGNGIIFSNNYMDSMLGTYMTIGGDSWTVTGNRFYNNGDPGGSSNCINLDGNHCTLMANIFIEPNGSNRITDCVRCAGGDNIIIGHTATGTIGDAIEFIAPDGDNNVYHSLTGVTTVTNGGTGNLTLTPA